MHVVRAQRFLSCLIYSGKKRSCSFNILLMNTTMKTNFGGKECKAKDFFLLSWQKSDLFLQEQTARIPTNAEVGWNLSFVITTFWYIRNNIWWMIQSDKNTVAIKQTDCSSHVRSNEWIKISLSWWQKTLKFVQEAYAMNEN